MSNHVYVVSEWLPKKGCEEKAIQTFKALTATTKESEKGCVSARVTHQISHPGSTGKTKFTIVLFQEYTSIEAFDEHCEARYVKDFFTMHIDNPETTLFDDWRCRLFSEE